MDIHMVDHYSGLPALDTYKRDRTMNFVWVVKTKLNIL
jgi:hypothetical protein